MLEIINSDVYHDYSELRISSDVEIFYKTLINVFSKLFTLWLGRTN